MAKILVSNQHGAVVMALLPFLYGMLSSHFIWQHLFLLLAWFCLYLFTYPFFNLFKGRNFILNKQWCWRYGLTALLAAVPVLWHNWQIVYFLLAMLPFGLLMIYYVKQKNERALVNDLAAIVIFGLAGMAVYYFADQRFDNHIWKVFFYPSLFFVGTTLHVKSMLRERKNPRYFKLSISFHLLVVGIIAVFHWQTALCFVLPLLRAIAARSYVLSVKQIGLIEFGISAWFLLSIVFVSIKCG